MKEQSLSLQRSVDAYALTAERDKVLFFLDAAYQKYMEVQGGGSTPSSYSLAATCSQDGEASSSVAAACPAVGGHVMNVRGFASALAASPKEADEEEAICGAKAAEEAHGADTVHAAVPKGASIADTRVLPTRVSPKLLRPISCPPDDLFLGLPTNAGC